MANSFRSSADKFWVSTAANGFPGAVPFSAAITITGGTTAYLGGTKSLTASVAITGGVDGYLSGIKRLSAHVFITGGTSATSSGDRNFTAAIEITGGMYGLPTLQRCLSASITITGGMRGKVKVGLPTLTQAQRLDLRVQEPLHLVTWALTSTTLYLADRFFSYRYGASELLYEPYLDGISGLGQIVEGGTAGSVMNSEIQIRFKNLPYGGSDYLFNLNATQAFSRSLITVHELRLVEGDEGFDSDVRVLLGTWRVERVGNISREGFTLFCSSLLYDARNKLGLERITTDIYPNCDPDDLGKYRNVLYGGLSGVPCRSVVAGAMDTLTADHAALATTITVSGATRIAFPSIGINIQIEDEQIYCPTGFSSNVATGCVRGAYGTTAVVHDKGTAVFQVLTEYIYEIAAHPVHSIPAIYVDKVRQTSGVTLYTGQPGSQKLGYPARALAVFTALPVIKKQVNLTVSTSVLAEHNHGVDPGSHAHGMSSAPVTITKPWTAASGGVNPDAAIDGNQSTTQCVLNNATLTLTAESGTYGTLSRVVVRVLVSYGANLVGSTLTVRYGSAVLGTITASVVGGANAGWWTFTRTTGVWSNSVTLTASMVAGATNAFGIWEVDLPQYTYTPIVEANPATGVYAAAITATVASSTLSGNSSADVVIGREVTVDVNGHFDDGAGSYTGTPGALIQRPDHVVKHILMSRCAFALSTIGTSFATSGALYAADSYALAFILHDVATETPDLLGRLAAQCRSSFHEWAGKFELKRFPNSTPAADLTIDEMDVDAEPVFELWSSAEVRNKVRAFYKRSYERDAGAGSGGDVLSGIDPDALAAGYLGIKVMSTSPADLEEDLHLSAVRLDAMALDVATYWRNWKQTARARVSLSLKWRAMQLAPGSHFSWTDPMLGAATYRVTRFYPDRAAGRIQVEGVAA